MFDLLQIKDKPHAVILVNNRLSDVDTYIHRYIKSIINNPIYDEKIDTNNFLDVIWYNEVPSKDRILEIIKKFSSSSLEMTNKKFYVIKNIELLNTYAANSLLKFLEEPYEGIYAIFTTANISKVISTISSRCQIFNIPYARDAVNNLLQKFNLSECDKEIVINVFTDLDEFTNSLDDNLQIINFSKKLKASCDDIVEYKKNLDFFKKVNNKQITIILRILFFLYKKPELLDIIDVVNLNLIKPLLFDKIIQIIK